MGVAAKGAAQLDLEHRRPKRSRSHGPGPLYWHPPVARFDLHAQVV